MSRAVKIVFATLAIVMVQGHAAQAKPGKPAAAPAPDGRQIYQHWCAPCHSPSYRAPGTSALGVKYGKDLPAVLEQRTDLTPEVIAYFVRNGVSIMPFFRKSEISDADLAALSNYLTKKKSARR